MAGPSWKKFLPPRFSPADPTKFVPRLAPDEDVLDFKKRLLALYDVPTKKDMLVIVPFFNPCNSLRMTQNVLLVIDKLNASNIPFIVIHALYTHSAPLGLKDNYVTVRTGSYAFIKENLANIVINKQKNNYAKFCILDGDIIFERANWYKATSNALEHADVIQPFTEYINLDADFHSEVKRGRSILAQRHNPEIDDMGDVKGHTGYCIAFTNRFLNTVGYPELNLLGGGDMIVCSLALGMKMFSRHGHKQYYDFVYDKHSIGKKSRCGVVDGIVYHLKHGDFVNRQYVTRYSILYKYLSNENGDTSKHITDIMYKNKDGVYEWIDEIKKSINNDVLSYFTSRDDDSV